MKYSMPKQSNGDFAIAENVKFFDVERYERVVNSTLQKYDDGLTISVTRIECEGALKERALAKCNAASAA